MSLIKRVTPSTVGLLCVAPTLSCLIAAPSWAGSTPGAAQLRSAPGQASSTELAQAFGNGGSAGFQQSQGWYFTLGAGASQPSNNNWNSNVSNASGYANFGGGFALDTGVGYDFGAIRTELTYSYNNASLNQVAGQVNGVGGLTQNVSGVVNKNDVLVSAYWDIPGGGRWVPYIGGGIGYTNLSTPNFNLGGFNTSGANQGLFGWQAKAGIAYALDTNWDIYAEGVYQGASSYNSGNVSFSDFNNWGGKLGFRYRFGHAAQVAAPAPAPAPEPAPVYQQPAPAPAPQPAPAPVRGLW